MCSVDVANGHFQVSMSRTGGPDKPMARGLGVGAVPMCLAWGLYSKTTNLGICQRLNQAGQDKH